jgi:hypothetical protein
MLFNEFAQALLVKVIDWRSDLTKRAVNDGMLMDFHIELAPSILVDFLVERVADTKKRQFTLCQAIPERPAKKVIRVGEPETIFRLILHRGRDRIAKGVIHKLIRIQKKDPRLLWWVVQ